jgi:hypothetical protein
MNYQTYNYCTLFDSHYLNKGLVLYESLLSVGIKFHLYIVAFDNECYYKLNSLNLHNSTIISLIELENEQLLSVKPKRNRAEYCWTCGPSVIYYCIQNYNLDHCTYLDADLMFFASPEPIYKEFKDSSIAITEHFTEKIDELGGKFCVQFVYFRNDENGMEALTWWKDQCIEWCFAKFEDGKYGDQKYLDYFPLKFKNVHIISNRGVGVAPWNMKYYSFPKKGFLIYQNNLISIIFFHYHGTKIDHIEESLQLQPVTYDINKETEQNIFIPYLQSLQKVYINYLDIKILSLEVSKRNFIEIIYSKFKKRFRHNSLLQYLYFNLFDFKYNGFN